MSGGKTPPSTGLDPNKTFRLSTILVANNRLFTPLRKHHKKAKLTCIQKLPPLHPRDRPEPPTNFILFLLNRQVKSGGRCRN
jgi:hypothetical protein